MPAYGTLTLFDDVAANTLVARFGEGRAFEVLNANLEAYNSVIRDAVAELAMPTTETQLAYGTSEEGEMIPADEYTSADVQRVTGGGTVGFPLGGFQYALQWSRLWMEMHTVADLELQYFSARNADQKRILKEMRKAIFTPTNNLTYKDRRMTNTTYAVRAFLNGDSQPIPTGPNNEVFNVATHTHYLGSAALDVTAANALIDTVFEHGHTGNIRIYTSRSNEAAWRALAGFIAYVDPRVTATPGTARETLDISNPANRAIGVFGPAEIWVKPWMIANYHFAFDAASPLKPLGIRTRPNTNLGNLQVAAENEAFPLRAQFMEREFGFAPFTRTNGAVLKSDNATYSAPAGL